MTETKIAIKSRANGELVGMMTLAEDDGGPLDQLQRTVDNDMRGHVVSWATAAEVREFEKQRRVN